MRLPTAFLLFSNLPALAAASTPAAEPADCSPSPVVQQGMPGGGAGEDYWTPERMRNAKPVEMHPTGPLDGQGAKLPPCPSDSRGAPGSPGTGEVAPDPNNVIMPAEPDEMPVPGEHREPGR